MTGLKSLEASWRDVTTNYGSSDNASCTEARLPYRCGHRPGGLTSGNDHSRRRAFQNATRERTGDEPDGIRSINRCAQNVVKIVSKSVERTSQ